TTAGRSARREALAQGSGLGEFVSGERAFPSKTRTTTGPDTPELTSLSTALACDFRQSKKKRAGGFPTARLLRASYLLLPVSERIVDPERQVVERGVAHPVEERALVTRHLETPVTGEREELRATRDDRVRVHRLRLELGVPHRHREGT